MLSDLLKKDLRQLAARGVNLTPADIVRLNALAVRVELTQHPCNAVNLPRVAFLPRTGVFGGEIMLREPTIAHELWIEEAGRWIDVSDERNFYWLYGFALSKFRVEQLPDAYKPRAVVKAVFGFAAKRLSRYTVRQLSAAVDYVLYGADWTACEHAAPRPDKGGGQKRFTGDTASVALGRIADARAIRLGISLEDARRMTASELEETVVEALVAAGEYDGKAARHSALGDYVVTRDEIVEEISRKERRDFAPSAAKPDCKVAE